MKKFNIEFTFLNNFYKNFKTLENLSKKIFYENKIIEKKFSTKNIYTKIMLLKNILKNKKSFQKILNFEKNIQKYFKINYYENYFSAKSKKYKNCYFIFAEKIHSRNIFDQNKTMGLFFGIDKGEIKSVVGNDKNSVRHCEAYEVGRSNPKEIASLLLRLRLAVARNDEVNSLGRNDEIKSVVKNGEIKSVAENGEIIPVVRNYTIGRRMGTGPGTANSVENGYFTQFPKKICIRNKKCGFFTIAFDSIYDILYIEDKIRIMKDSIVETLRKSYSVLVKGNVERAFSSCKQ